MKKQITILLIVGVTILALLSGCNTQKAPSVSGANQGQQDNSPGSSKLSSQDLRRINEEGEVALDITFANPLGQNKAEHLSFIVLVNTHSVDLSSNPLNQYAKLYDNKGKLLADRSEWEAEGDGHHLVGKLHFKIGQDISSIDGLRLVVENFGGAAKRDFNWKKEHLAL